MCRKQVGVVGSQTRSGVFGVCLVSETDETLVFSARPKSRLWRARASDGKVLQTIKLKPSLACSSSVVVRRALLCFALLQFESCV
jgi:hypothetical protein